MCKHRFSTYESEIEVEILNEIRKELSVIEDTVKRIKQAMQ